MVSAMEWKFNRELNGSLLRQGELADFKGARPVETISGPLSGDGSSTRANQKSHVDVDKQWEDVKEAWDNDYQAYRRYTR